MRAKARRHAGTKAPSATAAAHAGLSRFDLYELCVQDSARMAAFLLAAHGEHPRVMREDFSGSGGVCRAWAGLGPSYRAIAVDQDPEPLARLRRVPRVRPVCADAMDCQAPADVISATNFPIGYWHTRAQLARYLKLTRRRLKPGGVFVCDTYGGVSAFRTGSTGREARLPGGVRVRYTWEQREAEPRTRMVTDVIHFRVARRGKLPREIREAFTYRWRLWSISELRRAMRDAGFSAVELYDSLGDAVDEAGRLYVSPVRERDLGKDWVVYLAARR